jgi:HK97 family phage prohead protease
MSDIERRIFDAGRIEIRKGPIGSPGSTTATTVRGYAAKYNMLSEPMFGFREQIAPGAFDSVLDNDVRCFFNHDSSLILGRTAAGTLRITADETGLMYEADLPDTQAARDLAVSMERGDITQSSFAFRIAPNGDTWDENEDGVIIRTITNFWRLYDVSPVSIPAYPDATAGMRSLEAWKSVKNSQNEAETAQKRAKLAQFHAAKRRMLRIKGQ